jgi:hypothetical protein
MSIKLIDYTNFEIGNLTFSELSEGSKGMLRAYPQYIDPDTKRKIKDYHIQTPWIELNDYGIPKLGDFFPTDNEREFIRIPCDLNESTCVEFANILKQLDTTMSSKEKKEELFQKNWKKYKYSPSFREVIDQNQDDDEDETDKRKQLKNKVKKPSIKLKFDIAYDTKENNTIIYHSVMENEKRVRTKLEKENLVTIDDYVRAIPYMSKIRCHIKPVSLWAHGPKKPDPMYGITWKVHKIEVEVPSNYNVISKEARESDNFIDSDNDEPQSKQTTIHKTISKVNTEIVSSESDTKVKDNSESDDSESDDDELKPVVNNIVNVSSDDESEDEKPIVTVDSSSEEEIEEIKPKPTRKSKTSKK